MPKYVLKTLDSNASPINKGANRPFEKNLLNLSALGIQWKSSLIKQIRSDLDMNTTNNDSLGYINPAMYNESTYPKNKNAFE